MFRTHGYRPTAVHTNLGNLLLEYTLARQYQHRALSAPRCLGVVHCQDLSSSIFNGTLNKVALHAQLMT
jgi:hypothetical protein